MPLGLRRKACPRVTDAGRVASCHGPSCGQFGNLGGNTQFFVPAVEGLSFKGLQPRSKKFSPLLLPAQIFQKLWCC